MTAIPHEGVSASSLRRSVIRPRTGARLVRPGIRKQASSATTRAESVAVSGSVGVVSAPTGLAAIPSMLGLRHLQFVLVGRRVRMGHGAFVFAVLAALTATLGALLFLNTALAENSFQLTNIRQNMRELTVQEQVLSSELAAAESPIGLQEKARALGMISAGSPVFLRLSDGKVLGEESPAVPPEVYAPKDAVIPPVGGESAVGFASEGASSGTATESGSTGSGESAATPGSAGNGTTESQSGSGTGESPLGMVSGGSR